MPEKKLENVLSALPKVDRILEHQKVKPLLDKLDKHLLLKITQDMLSKRRRELKRAYKSSKPNIKAPSIDFFADELTKKVDTLFSDNLVHLVNATGTVLHTNLGRAPLAKDDLKKAASVSGGYSNLEFDIETGKRGSRYSHFEEVVKLVTGSEAALAVNNNAAAVLLVLNTFSEGKEAVVSRGELIEIGGSFRIPEVMKKSQAILKEVGTTNKTHLKDYKKAITKETGLLLKVHTSNYKIVGFTKEVTLPELVTLGKESRVIVYNDLGSGCLIDLSEFGLEKEDTVQDVIKTGADIVSFSGDKLLGGPQAGVVVGKKKYIDKIKGNPLTRALRLDKMTLSALEQTFKTYLNRSKAVRSIPVMKMLTTKDAPIKKRCIQLFEGLKKLKKRSVSISMHPDFSCVGGGALPLEKVNTHVIAIKSKKLSCANIAKKFRDHQTRVIVRVSNDEVVLDMRTVLKSEEKYIIEAFNTIF